MTIPELFTRAASSYRTRADDLLAKAMEFHLQGELYRADAYFAAANIADRAAKAEATNPEPLPFDGGCICEVCQAHYFYVRWKALT